MVVVVVVAVIVVVVEEEDSPSIPDKAAPVAASVPDTDMMGMGV